MLSNQRARLGAGLAMLAALSAAGCQSSPPVRVQPRHAAAHDGSPTEVTAGGVAQDANDATSAHPSGNRVELVDSGGELPLRPVTTVQYLAPAATRQPQMTYAEDDPFGGQDELSLGQLVDEVLARNPSLAAAVAAWRAAAQRYPQVISLDDPMFGYMLGPGSFGDERVETAWMVELSQQIPWPGKRQLRGQRARAEAAAAREDMGEVRLRLAEAAKLAFFDYYLSQQHLLLNAENQQLVEQFREIAQSKYESGEVQQQDVLLAEVDLAQLERRRVELLRQERVAAARINTLMLRVPDYPLPPAPRQVELAAELPAAEVLHDLALAERPDLAAQAARIRAERAELALANREFYPDFEAVARYDAFWQEDPLRPMVGLSMNVPIQRARRRAAVREASARLAQRQAEFQDTVAQVQYAVQVALEQAQESRRAVELYNESILPAAESSLESAQAGYVAGEIDFLRLVEAERQLIELRDERFASLAQYHRNLAELERAVGGRVPPAYGTAEE